MHKIYSMLFPGFRPRAFTVSYDDGVIQDMRLIELMEKYGIYGTFNINSRMFAEEGTVYTPADVGHMRMTLAECKKAYSSPNVEIAVHGADHCFPTAVPAPVAVDEFLSDRIALEKEFGQIIRGSVIPNGGYNEMLHEVLRLCGFLFTRATKASHGFNPPDDLLRLSPTCHHTDPKLFELIDSFLTDPSYPKPYPYLFFLWGHSYEFDEQNNWELIEDVFKRVVGRDDTWYATNTAIFEYYEAFRQLIFSADGSRAYNPTVTDLYIRTKNGNYKIPSGETVSFEL